MAPRIWGSPKALNTPYLGELDGGFPLESRVPGLLVKVGPGKASGHKGRSWATWDTVASRLQKHHHRGQTVTPRAGKAVGVCWGAWRRGSWGHVPQAPPLLERPPGLFTRMVTDFTDPQIPSPRW